METPNRVFSTPRLRSPNWTPARSPQPSTFRPSSSSLTTAAHPNSTREELLADVRRLQRENAELRNKVRDLEINLQKLQNQSKAKEMTTEEKKEDEVIAQTARHFCFAHCLWTTANAKQLAAVAIEYAGGSNHTYSNPPTIAEELHRRLCGFLPQKLKDRLTDVVFCTNFLSKLSTFRSSYQHTLRKHTVELLDEFHLSDSEKTAFSKQDTRSSHSRAHELSGRQSRMNNVVEYPSYCPLTGVGNMQFKTQIIVEIFKLVLYGPSAINDKKPQRSSNSNINSWDDFKVTAGGVATALVGARYMLSPDTQFKESGNNTKVAWSSEWQLYRNAIEAIDPDSTGILRDIRRRIFSAEQETSLSHARISDEEDLGPGDTANRGSFEDHNRDWVDDETNAFVQPIPPPHEPRIREGSALPGQPLVGPPSSTSLFSNPPTYMPPLVPPPWFNGAIMSQESEMPASGQLQVPPVPSTIEFISPGRTSQTRDDLGIAHTPQIQDSSPSRVVNTVALAPGILEPTLQQRTTPYVQVSGLFTNHYSRSSTPATNTHPDIGAPLNGTTNAPEERPHAQADDIADDPLNGDDKENNPPASGRPIREVRKNIQSNIYSDDSGEEVAGPSRKKRAIGSSQGTVAGVLAAKAKQKQAASTRGLTVTGRGRGGRGTGRGKSRGRAR
ncbi:hypothetical protein FRB91_000221 [Serendipita sp. 411]|nr:hypothetical protein FRC18_004869 [Serendipita sp. 400]KAG8847083.1 hypothetical protein FRB91_000221 [Serendipita sp. 411]